MVRALLLTLTLFLFAGVRTTGNSTSSRRINGRDRGRFRRTRITASP